MVFRLAHGPSSPSWDALYASQLTLFGDFGRKAGHEVEVVKTFADFAAVHRLRTSLLPEKGIDAAADVVAELLLLAAGDRAFLLVLRARHHSRALAVLRRHLLRHWRERTRRIAAVLRGWQAYEAQVRQAGLLPARAGRRSRVLFSPTIVPDELKEGTVQTLYRERHAAYRRALREWKAQHASDPSTPRPRFVFHPSNVAVPELVALAWAIPPVSPGAVERRLSRLRSEASESPASSLGEVSDVCETDANSMPANGGSWLLTVPSAECKRRRSAPTRPGTTAASPAAPHPGRHRPALQAWGPRSRALPASCPDSRRPVPHRRPTSAHPSEPRGALPLLAVTPADPAPRRLPGFAARLGFAVRRRAESSTEEDSKAGSVEPGQPLDAKRLTRVVADSLVSEVRVKDGTLLQTLDKASGCYVRQSAGGAGAGRPEYIWH